LLKFREDDQIEKNDKTGTSTVRFYHAHATGYDLTEDEGLLETTLHAADIMSQRFNPNGNFFQQNGEIDSSPTAQKIEINTMASAIPLMCWAYEKTQDPRFKQMILQHCDATILYLMNEDGSTVEVAEFNPTAQVRTGTSTHHGWARDSCYSRGQANAMTGFVHAYKTTGEKRLLEAAEKTTRFYIDHLPEDFVPPYDFNDPTGIPKDSSAPASAMLNIFLKYGR